MIATRQLSLPGFRGGLGIEHLSRPYYLHGKRLTHRIRWYFFIHESLSLPREQTAMLIRDALIAYGEPFKYSRTRLRDVANIFIVAGDVDMVTVQDNEYWLNPTNPEHLTWLPRMVKGSVDVVE